MISRSKMSSFAKSLIFPKQNPFKSLHYISKYKVDGYFGGLKFKSNRSRLATLSIKDRNYNKRKYLSLKLRGYNSLLYKSFPHKNDIADNINSLSELPDHLSSINRFEFHPS